MSGQSPETGSAAARAFADHVVATDFESLGGEARAAAAAFTLDTIGVGVAGAAQPYAQGLRRALACETAGHVRLWGGGGAGDAKTAVYVNAFQAHCQFEARQAGEWKAGDGIARIRTGSEPTCF